MREDLIRVEHGCFRREEELYRFEISISRGECIGVYVDDHFTSGTAYLDVFRGGTHLERGRAFSCGRRVGALELERWITQNARIVNAHRFDSQELTVRDFLLALDRGYLLGMVLFCGVQLCWFLRLRALCRRSFWAARLGLFLLSLGALAALGLWNSLNVLSLFYFANFACNTALSLSRRWEGPLRLLPPGLVLYLCCDLCVAAFQFPQALPALYPFVQVGMWLFYLPGQVLLALSGLPLSGQKLSRGDRL